MFMNEALKFTQLTIDNQTNCRYGSLNTYFVSWVYKAMYKNICSKLLLIMSEPSLNKIFKCTKNEPFY